MLPQRILNYNGPLDLFCMEEGEDFDSGGVDIWDSLTEASEPVFLEEDLPLEAPVLS